MMQRDKYTQDEKCIAGFMRDVAAYLGIIYFSLMEMFTVYSSINSLESKQSCDMQQSPPPPCSDSLHYSPLLHYHLSQQYVHLLSLLSTHCRISEKNAIHNTAYLPFFPPSLSVSTFHSHILLSISFT